LDATLKIHRFEARPSPPEPVEVPQDARKGLGGDVFGVGAAPKLGERVTENARMVVVEEGGSRRLVTCGRGFHRPLELFGLHTSPD